MKKLIFSLVLLVSSVSSAVGPFGVNYDFSPFPLKEGKVIELAGEWGSDESLVRLTVLPLEYWSMPMFSYEEQNIETGETVTGFAWVSHSKEHYWLSLAQSSSNAERTTKKLYFGNLTGVHNFSKSCGKTEQIMAIMIVEQHESLEVVDEMDFFIDHRANYCDFGANLK